MVGRWRRTNPPRAVSACRCLVSASFPSWSSPRRRRGTCQRSSPPVLPEEWDNDSAAPWALSLRSGHLYCGIKTVLYTIRGRTTLQWRQKPELRWVRLVRFFFNLTFCARESPETRFFFFFLSKLSTLSVTRRKGGSQPVVTTIVVYVESSRTKFSIANIYVRGRFLYA